MRKGNVDSTADECNHIWSESTSYSHFWCYKCGAYLHKFTKRISYPLGTAADKGPKEIR